MSSTTSNLSKFVHSPVFGPALVWVVCLLGTMALASIVSLLGITPAWSGTPPAPSVTVSFRDLDLSRAEGATTLYHRIQAAAKQVCGYTGADLIEQAIWRNCYRSAVADAVGRVNNPMLTAVHTGRPPAMTAMLTK